MTNTPKIYKTEAIVLRHFPLGEADYLLDLYTPDLGKLRAVAKGARRVKSKLGGHLEPLMRTSFLITRGQNLDTINQAEVLEGFRTVREHLHRLSQALYIVELIDTITPEEQPNYPIYRLVLDALRSLAGDATPLLLPFFQLRILGHSGFKPQLYQCVECGSTISPGLHRLTPDLGGTLCNSCHPPNVTVLPISLDSLKVLRFFQREEYVSVQRLRLGSGIMLELERLLESLLRHVLEREVKTSRFLSQVTQGSALESTAAITTISTEG